MSAVCSHRFLVCRPPRPPISWDPPQTTDETGHDLTYLGRAVAAASRAIVPPTPLTFVITWDLHDIPVTGRHVVAIVQGDEDARIPAWSNDVLITFKCYGTRPHWMPVFPQPGLSQALELAHFARRVCLWVPGVTHRALATRRPWRPRPPIVAIPLGYYNQLDHPLVPFGERKWSVTFAGSVTRDTDGAHGWRQHLGTPKNRARAEMWEAVKSLTLEFPDEPVELVGLEEFPALLPGNDKVARSLAAGYSELLAQTRVCLAPRGNSSETFRLFEGLRAGCVVVCESLPNHWFYRGAPLVRLRRWDQLVETLRPLLADRAEMEALHRASVEWWETRCSEAALGRFMAAQICRVGSRP